MNKTYFYDNFSNIIALNHKKLNLISDEIIILQLFYIDICFNNQNSINLNYLKEKTIFTSSYIKKILKKLRELNYYSLEYENNKFYISFDGLFEKIQSELKKKNSLNEEIIINRKRNNVSENIRRLKSITRISWD